MEQERPLARDIAFFETSLEEWLKLYPGRVVLVKGRALIGVFDNESNALGTAARHYGRGPYLIRRVLREQPMSSNLALSLGMISAAPR